MTARMLRWCAAAAGAVLLLSSCSNSVSKQPAKAVTVGSIEVAVSEVCTVGSDAQCISVGGAGVIAPAEFELLDVTGAIAPDKGTPDVIEVTLDKTGAEKMHALTAEALSRGQNARLVISAGGEIQTAVSVMDVFSADQTQISISPVDDSEGLINLILDE